MNLELEISYSKLADKFLDKNKSVITKAEVNSLLILAIRKIVKKEDVNVNLLQLRGEPKGIFRIKTGKIRIIFRFQKTKIYIVFVEDVSFRKDAYK